MPTAAKPKKVDAAVRAAAMRLRKAGVVFAHGTTDPRAEAAFLLGEVIGFPPDDYGAHADAPLTPAQAQRFGELIEARIETRKPAAYLVNKMYMFGLPFYVDERVIVPRSFIGELLASHFGEDGLIGDPQEVTRVIDLCTGSGCLAILAAYAFPNAHVDATDLSAAALEVAKKNVALHALERRVTLHKGDLYDAVGDARYDLIISNPPYVDAQGMASLPPECRVEPAMAFDGGVDGLDLVRRIVDGAAARLTEQGGLLCEIGRGRAQTEAAWPRLPFLWLDTEASEGEVFWLERYALK
jgi:ribosomal protein L3 glutamine methyltransferase